MNWVEHESKNRKDLKVTSERAALLDKVKAEALPPIRREAANGDKSVQPVRFQPVKSPGIFEAEFGEKDGNVIFHFWPWGFHEAERNGQPRVAFVVGFGNLLKKTMHKHFGTEIEVIEDRDMGSWFVKIPALGKKQFWFELAVKAATEMHTNLGGK